MQEHIKKLRDYKINTETPVKNDLYKVTSFSHRYFTDKDDEKKVEVKIVKIFSVHKGRYDTTVNYVFINELGMFEYGYDDLDEFLVQAEKIE